MKHIAFFFLLLCITACATPPSINNVPDEEPQISIEANRFYEQALDLDEKEEFESAEKFYRKAMNIWDNNISKVPLLNSFALNLSSQDKNEDALKLLKQAKSLDPKNMEIERNIRIISTLNEPIRPFD